MIKKFDLIAGPEKDIKEYIESLDTFDCWQIGKTYYTQIERLLARPVLGRHIGAVTYQSRNDDGTVSIHAAFIAINN
jgi:hypothetical protein